MNQLLIVFGPVVGCGRRDGQVEKSGTVHVDFMDAAAVLDLVDNRAAHQLAQEVRESRGRVITAL